MNQQSSLWQDAWRRLLANKAAVAGGFILCLFIINILSAIDQPNASHPSDRIGTRLVPEAGFVKHSPKLH